MGSLYRRADILGFRKLFLDRLLGSDARWVAMPGVDYSLMIREGLFEKTGFPVLEGGDVIVLGKTVLVGISANPATGSSELGYQWLKSYLGPMGYEVKDVPLQKEILHLDIALSVPRPGLIIVCPDAFVRGIEEYFPKHEWKTIMFSVEEATHLAINGLPINQDTYVIGTNEHFDAEKLERDLNDHGVRTVYRIPFAHHTEDGGSIRCSTHPLVRRMR
jgi:N-dimethylarginine dimethylaminohydrolase